MRPPLRSLELMALSIACHPSRPSFHTGQGRALDREGAPETRCKGRETRRGHTTQLYSFLSSPAMLASNSPSHLGTIKHIPTTTCTHSPHPTPPASFFAIRNVATRTCSIGEAGEGGGLPSPLIHASFPHHHRTHTALRSWRQLLQRPLGLRG